MAETVAERIARVIGERIVAGELAAGTPLRQDHIAEEFDASHVPAREAFQLLRAQGLVVSEPRRGMRVAPLDQASIQETVEIRAALETLALRLAAPKINAAAFERIELALAAGDQAKTIEEWEQANRNFHKELLIPCRMPRLLSMLDDLQLANSRIIFSATRSAGWRPGSSHAHRQIVDTLKKRDFHSAVSLLDAHIRGLERATNDGRSAAAQTKPLPR
ncbi:DNA-binding GntR family transcriptional regulator [Rhizobium sp. BK275]|uniref:GntR family transcriptional regulator n=1 Tax=unclassified Rhizobium TaxID=2613769 RepID=UPI00160AE71D|nr:MULTISPECIES: GntR family transcriptional regulator [unclassified Rhizobium]MBB3387722.1 DNA-binding GntR family transcriptional regulator [Rhizobium sp. BK275]MBB3407070.1 DNA-binding GntR family transcriptional regulator [Rhizobium sp. BK316]